MALIIRVCDTPFFLVEDTCLDTLLFVRLIIEAATNRCIHQKDYYPKWVSLGKTSPSFFFFLVNMPSSVPWLASLL